MSRVAGKHKNAEPVGVAESAPSGTAKPESEIRDLQHKLLTWLTGVILIFSLLYGTSYFALLSLPPQVGMDTRSQLTANYRPWSYLALEPVDHAIIEDIRKEREIPEQIVIPGSFWPTPTSTVEPSSNLRAGPTSQTTTESEPQPDVPQSTSSLPVTPPSASIPNYASTTTPTQTIATAIPVVEETETQSSAAPTPTELLEPTKTPEPEAYPEKTKRPLPTRNPHHTPPPTP